MRSRLLALALLLAAGPAVAQTTDMANVLDRAAARVSAFLELFSDVKCTEHVKLEKLNQSGHVEHVENAVYDYFVLLEATNEELQLSESRLEQQVKPRPDRGKKVVRTAATNNVPMLITNGFSTLFLIFHPYYRDTFRFEREPDEVVDGERRLRIRFIHVPGTRSPAAVAVRGREYPLELAGTAWMDPKDASITRIEATLANDMLDVGLRSIRTEIDFAPVKLPGWTEPYRFPIAATVDLESLRQHWRNFHRFDNYQRFLVETQQAVNKPATP